MLSNLKINNTNNVKYFGLDRYQTNYSFALYVQGKCELAQPYCVQAKRRLFACLIYLKQYLNEDDLVAIYLDVIDESNTQLPGFRLLIDDVRKGLFKKILIWDLESVLKIDKLHDQLIGLTKSEDRLEFFDLKGNLLQSDTLPISQLLGV